ncbi:MULTISPECIES: beta-ketoacyl synthase N-terminal-like domain-containing protein [unclassified Nocardiopsis]|uniref:beta-ketoacyl synthase N-terminal-like domain-containing protein n=1 Tax=unclassified Nocardiopsis TaxID=2649073 RepID=UPI0013567707|nr:MULTISPECIES: beta-ketoacyl synthase N-terminal-like domain-containing protein [unclassified Nocardiopsis]
MNGTRAGVPTLAITGWSAVSPIGTGADGFTEAVREGRGGGADVSGMFDAPLPSDRAHAIPGFRASDHLGRKGTRHLDRSTALALVATKLALEATDADVAADGRVGVVLGTTAGSVRTTSEFSRDTLVQERPYLVNPVMFPSATINCPAGRSAIWHGLRGVNATVAGGQMSGLNVLRYGAHLIAGGHSDVLLAGAVEEFSPHMAWGHRALTHGYDVPLGEGSAVFVVEDAERVRAQGRLPEAEVLASAFGSGAPEDTARTLESAVTRALRLAGVDADGVWGVATGEHGIAGIDTAEDEGVRAALGGGPVRVRVKPLVGECNSASGPFQLAALLARYRSDPGLHGRVSVLTSVSADGAAGAAVVRGRHMPGPTATTAPAGEGSP